MKTFEQTLQELHRKHDMLLSRENIREEKGNGIAYRYHYPVVTNEHIPLEWRYDFNPATNPHCLERIGMNACMNAGAIKWKEKYLLMVRVEGADRKSFLPSPKARTGWITSVSGNGRSTCRISIRRRLTYMICA